MPWTSSSWSSSPQFKQTHEQQHAYIKQTIQKVKKRKNIWKLEEKEVEEEENMKYYGVVGNIYNVMRLTLLCSCNFRRIKQKNKKKMININNINKILRKS